MRLPGATFLCCLMKRYQERQSIMPFSNNEKLIIAMLVDLYRPPEDRQLDPQLIEEAVLEGHEWALSYAYQGLFAYEDDTDEDLQLVHDVLDAWERIELGFKALDSAGKKRVQDALGYEPSYEGWDGNNESEYMGIVRMLTTRLDRHTYFADRADLNSHMPTLHQKRRMVERFREIRSQVSNHDLTETQIIHVLGK